jgi:hypothetical protein
MPLFVWRLVLRDSLVRNEKPIDSDRAINRAAYRNYQ